MTVIVDQERDITICDSELCLQIYNSIIFSRVTKGHLHCTLSLTLYCLADFVTLVPNGGFRYQPLLTSICTSYM